MSESSCVSLSDITMGCGSGKPIGDMNGKRIVVFGATGRVGGSVVRALIRDTAYRVIAVSRDIESKPSMKLKEEGVQVVRGDLEEKADLEKVLIGAYGCFVVTSYWDHYDIIRDTKQGKNVVDAAITCHVEHLIYIGQESPKKTVDMSCDYFEAKQRVEEYMKNYKELGYTVIRPPYFFDNILSMIPPHKLADGSHAIVYPMADVPLDGMAIDDLGECVHRIFNKVSVYRRKTVKLSGDRLTVQEYADVLSKYLAPKIFVDSKITLEDYKQFKFLGAKELLAMFAFYQFGRPVRDITATRRLYRPTMTFDRWVAKYKDKLDEIIT